MRLKICSAMIVTMLTLTSCQPGAGQGGFADMFTKENIGALTGAAGGAWLGSNVGKGKGNVAAIAVGTLLGAGLGKSIGASLDAADMSRYNQTSQRALETQGNGHTSTWNNPDSGNSGTITPIKTYQTSNGTHCREYSQTISVNGKYEEAYGTACRQADGTWQIQN
jgi:surface antigen